MCGPGFVLPPVSVLDALQIPRFQQAREAPPSGSSGGHGALPPCACPCGPSALPGRSATGPTTTSPMNEVKMSAGFDRSLLEGKDRDELMQIANALGEKPPSRAKKADIIALVLRAAGVEDDRPAAAVSPPVKPKRAPRARATAKADAG